MDGNGMCKETEDVSQEMVKKYHYLKLLTPIKVLHLISPAFTLLDLPVLFLFSLDFQPHLPRLSRIPR